MTVVRSGPHLSRFPLPKDDLPRAVRAKTHRVGRLPVRLESAEATNFSRKWNGRVPSGGREHIPKARTDSAQMPRVATVCSARNDIRAGTSASPQQKMEIKLTNGDGRESGTLSLTRHLCQFEFLTTRLPIRCFRRLFEKTRSVHMGRLAGFMRVQSRDEVLFPRPGLVGSGLG
jgi:hypothetical protein